MLRTQCVAKYDATLPRGSAETRRYPWAPSTTRSAGQDSAAAQRNYASPEGRLREAVGGFPGKDAHDPCGDVARR